METVRTYHLTGLEYLGFALGLLTSFVRAGTSSFLFRCISGA